MVKLGKGKGLATYRKPATPKPSVTKKASITQAPVKLPEMEEIRCGRITN